MQQNARKCNRLRFTVAREVTLRWPGGSAWSNVCGGLVHNPVKRQKESSEFASNVGALFLLLTQLTEFFVGYFAFFVLETIVYLDLRN